MKIIIGAIVLIIVALGGYFLFSSSSSGKACTSENAVSLDVIESSATSSAAISGVKITFDNGEVIPSCFKMSQGEEIVWVNAGEKNIQIAADPHPVHSGNKEVSDGGFILELAPGEEKTVTINKVGKTGYHDHLDSSAGGAIIVE